MSMPVTFLCSTLSGFHRKKPCRHLCQPLLVDIRQKLSHKCSDETRYGQSLDFLPIALQDFTLPLWDSMLRPT